jgi:hypothetical protein
MKNNTNNELREEIIQGLKPKVINYHNPKNKEVADVMQEMLNQFWEDFKPALREALHQREQALKAELLEKMPEERKLYKDDELLSHRNEWNDGYNTCRKTIINNIFK